MKPLLRSTVAVAAGLLVTAVASTAADAVMRATSIFPSSPQVMSDPLFGVAAACRALFAVAGGSVTVRLAPGRPWRHAWILAGIGTAAALAGVIAFYRIGGAQLGPAWYPIAILIEAIPCVALGAYWALPRKAAIAGN
jgi:hypothetical protein